MTEFDWDLQPIALRERIKEEFLSIMWSRRDIKMQFYQLYVNPMLVYSEQGYLLAEISTSLRHIISRHKTGSHSLGIEEGRWLNIDRSERNCSLCDGRKVQDEEHVFLTCTRYVEIRVAHKVVVENFYSLLQLEPYDLGCYIRDVICYRSSALDTS